MLILSPSAVSRLLTVEKALDVVETLFKEQGKGQVVAHPSFPISVEKGTFRVHSGALLAQKRVGVRLLPGDVRQLEREGEGEEITVICDSASGELLCVVLASLSKLRIGVVMGIAAKFLSPPDSRTVGLLGTGRNALGVLECVVATRPSLKEIWVYSRKRENREAFVRQAKETLGLKVRAAETAEEVVAGKDLVLTSTDSPTPVLKAEWLSPRAYFASTGAPTEVGEDIFAMAGRIVVSAKGKEGDLVTRHGSALGRVIQKGLVSLDDVRELGELVLAPGAERAFVGLTVFYGSPGGFPELAMAAWLHEEAQRQGLGHKVDLSN